MSLIREVFFEYGLPFEIAVEIERRMGLEGSTGDAADPGIGHSEAYAQSQVILEAPRYQCRLFRNNVGAFKDDAGGFVRYGLANESKTRNKRLKSSDLVGWRRRVITVDMIPPGGLLIGQAVLREIKEPGWYYTGDEHEEAQLRWLQLGLSDGCDAAFATGPGSFQP
jgi:hypothetical protein